MLLLIAACLLQICLWGKGPGPFRPVARVDHIGGTRTCSQQPVWCQIQAFGPLGLVMRLNIFGYGSPQPFSYRWLLLMLRGVYWWATATVFLQIPKLPHTLTAGAVHGDGCGRGSG